MQDQRPGWPVPPPQARGPQGCAQTAPFSGGCGEKRGVRGGAVSSVPLAARVTHPPSWQGWELSPGPGQGLRPLGQQGALQTAPADRRCRPCRRCPQMLVGPGAVWALREPSICPPGSGSHVVGRRHGEPRLGLISLI